MSPPNMLDLVKKLMKDNVPEGMGELAKDVFKETVNNKIKEVKDFFSLQDEQSQYQIAAINKMLTLGLTDDIELEPDEIRDLCQAKLALLQCEKLSAHD